VLAHMTGEESLVELQERPRYTLDDRFEHIRLPLAKVTDHQRMVGKTVNFSVLYGQTPFGLSKQLAIELDAAREIHR
jgi:DNA polymerase-1